MTTTHPADSHELIRVAGRAGEQPQGRQRRAARSAGSRCSPASPGSGKSSLVFATIAAESQRMINETYSAFVQGFMPTPGPARRRPPRGADDGDHRRPGADGRQPALDRRHRDRRQRDAADPLQPASATPHVGPPTAFSFNVPTRVASGVMTTEKGGRHARRASSARRSTWAACARAARAWARSTTSTCTAHLRRDEVALRGRAARPGLLAWTGGTAGSSSGVGLPMDKPIASFTDEAARDAALRRADEDQGRGRQPHLRGRHPQDPEVDAVQGPRGDAAARAALRRARGHLHRPAPTATAPG